MSERSPLLLVGLGTFVIAGVALVGCNGGEPSAKGPIDGGKAMDHVKVMVGHGPRPSGSPALEKTQAYIVSELSKLGLEDIGHRWNDPTQPAVRSFRNILVQIDGEDPVHGPILMFAAHYDTKVCTGHADPKHNIRFVGAIDGAGGPATLLELARHLKTRKNIANIWLLFLDGEESIPWNWDEKQSLYGSRYFVEKMNGDKKRFPQGLAGRVRAFVLIDLIGSKNQKIDKDNESNSTLRKIFEQTAKEMGEAARMFESESDMTDDHIPFKKAGLRVIDLIDFNYRTPNGPEKPGYDRWWHTEKDDVDAMDPVSLRFVGNLLWNALPHLEAKLCKR